MSTEPSALSGRDPSCLFCQILDRTVAAHEVLRVPGAVAFLDHRPVFVGHVLVVPDRHAPTLADLDPTELGPFFAEVRRVARALPEALGAHGTLVACNNVVSQSVPHLHVHVVPRRRRDGLRGFLWPRQSYPDEATARSTAALITRALERLDR